MSSPDVPPSPEETGDRPRVDPLFEKPPSSRLFRMIRRCLLVAIAFAILLLAGVSVLSLVGGNDDSLKEGLEKFFQDYTGMKTTIGTLNDLQIYPILRMDVENISAGGQGDSRNTGISARHIVIGMTFWDAIFSRGWIAASRIEGLSLPAGFLTPRALTIQSLSFSGEGPDAFLKASGVYNALPFAMSVAMQTRPSRGGSLYRIADQSAFTLTLGPLVFKGLAVRPQSHRGMDFSDLSISEGPDGKPFLVGSADFTRRTESYGLALHLRIAPESPESSEINARADFAKDGSISGIMVFPSVRRLDLAPAEPLGKLFALIHSLLLLPPSSSGAPASPPLPQGLGALTGHLDFAAGLADGAPPLLPSPPSPVKCLAGGLTFGSGNVAFDPLHAYGRDGRSLTAKGALSLSTGAAEPGWIWTEEPSSSGALTDLLSRVEGLIPPSTPCASLPGLAEP